MGTHRYTAEEVANMMGVPLDRVRAQYRKNASQLRDMACTARDRGGVYRGLTAKELDEAAADYEIQGTER